MAGITVVNPTASVEGTPDDDSFTVTNSAEGVASIEGEGGYDTFILDRSWAQQTEVSITGFDGGFSGIVGSVADHQFIIGGMEDLRITGDSGNDWFQFTLDTVSPGLTVNLDGGAGTDFLEFDFPGASLPETFDASGPTTTSSFGSFAGFEKFHITGGAGDDIIRTNAGNDYLAGGAGSNILDAGAGDDQIYSSSLTDHIDGGDGYDFLNVNYSDVSTDLVVNIGDAVSVNGAVVARNVEEVSGGGGSGNDTYTVSGGTAPTIYGGDGNDTLTAQLPTDTAQIVKVEATGDKSLDGGTTEGGYPAFTFRQFEHVDLVGSAHNDMFQLSGPIAPDQVALDGAGGSDTLTADFSLLDGATTFVAHADGTVNSNRGTFANFESFSITGGAGDDRITTRGGNDFVDGGAGNDIVHTGGGDDYLYAQGNDTLDGGGGSDTLDFDPDGAGLTVDLSFTGPQDTGQGSDTLTSIENLYGTMNDDVLLGNASDNVIRAQYGDDLLAGGDGDDLLDGGQGNDVASYASATQGVTVDVTLTGAQNTGQGHDTLIDIEGVIGSAYADYLTGGWNGFIDGGGGNDIVIGSGGDDAIEGGAGADMMVGGAGDDAFHVDTQSDLVFEKPGGGWDSIYSSASFYLYANVENLVLDDGTGDLFGVGNALDNVIVGNDGSNLLLGGLGNDTIDGGDGIDNLFGEGGNDTLNGEAGVDYIVGGDGDDAMDGGADADALYGQAGNDVLSGGTGFVTDILVGGDGDDTLYGNSGLGDYDRMDGGAGNDTYFVDTGDDLTFEAAGGGTDTVYANVAGANNGVYLYANVENLVLLGSTTFGVGNQLANRLTGNSAGNWLLGGDGGDTLNGKAGNDVLFGQNGNDTFVFEHGTGGDVIGDFVHGEDKIDLSAFHFASFADLQSHFEQVAGDGAIHLADGDFVVLQNIAITTLDAGDFVL
jgi:Ca2+-binding RTX toxin-like protein